MDCVFDGGVEVRLPEIHFLEDGLKNLVNYVAQHLRVIQVPVEALKLVRQVRPPHTGHRLYDLGGRYQDLRFDYNKLGRACCSAVNSEMVFVLRIKSADYADLVVGRDPKRLGPNAGDDDCKLGGALGKASQNGVASSVNRR